MVFSKYFFKVGSRFRNPHLTKNFAFLKGSESWALDQLKAYQLERCQKLLRFANEHSSFYKERFDLSGFDVDRFNDLDQLKLLPPVLKSDLIAQNSAIHTTGSHAFNKLFVSETSGSTGEPLMFMKDEVWDSWNRAAIFRGYSWYGINPWDRNGYFWGYNIDTSKAWKTRILDAFQNRFRVFSYERDELVDFIEKLKSAVSIGGYSSMIYEVARIINENGIDTSELNLKLIKGTSEKIYEHYHEEVQKAFGKKMVSEYGAAEAGAIAFECPNGSMHLNMEGCIVEEEDGEILVTNLNAYSFPVIRYKLGDSVVLENESFDCSCGMKHQVLREVTGRVGKRIFGKSKIYPSFTIYYVFKNLYLDAGISINGQFVQKKKGHLLVKVEQGLTNEMRGRLNAELESYFGADMVWDLEENAVIHTMEGKRKDFISEVE